MINETANRKLLFTGANYDGILSRVCRSIIQLLQDSFN